MYNDNGAINGHIIENVKYMLITRVLNDFKNIKFIIYDVEYRVI